MAAAVANVCRQQQQQSQQNQLSQQSSGRLVLFILVSFLAFLTLLYRSLVHFAETVLSAVTVMCVIRATVCMVPGMAVMETLWRHQMVPVLQAFPCLEDHPSGQSYRPPFTTPTPQISPVSDVTYVHDLTYYRYQFDGTWPLKVNLVPCLTLQACSIRVYRSGEYL